MLPHLMMKKTKTLSQEAGKQYHLTNSPSIFSNVCLMTAIVRKKFTQLFLSFQWLFAKGIQQAMKMQ
jgi:hypothetical protein